MTYYHGVRTEERATAIKSPANTTAGLPVVFGTAPLHLASDPAGVNKPVLCYTYAEAAAAFGYSDDWKNYSLCEFMYSEFMLYNVAPVVFVNVLDPATHKKDVTAEKTAVTAKVATVSEPVLLDTLVVKTAASSGETLVSGTDYEAAYDDDGVLQISALDGGKMAALTEIYLDYTKLDPSAVTKDDIIGGVASDGTAKGLEALDNVFPLTRIVPGIVAAPGWSDDPEVAAVMKSKAGNINGVWAAGAVLCDVPTDECTKYTDVPAWKEKNNYAGVDQVALWPMVKNGSKIYHMSTHLAGVIGATDAGNSDVPNLSPSNKTMEITGICLADGTEVVLNLQQANYLNGQGIVTALNWIGGWKAWGNRTCAYPSNTDAKDAFISSRRMFRWYSQRFIQTFWANVDDPINKRLVETIVNSANIDLNGLTAGGYLLGGRIVFEADFNPTTNLLDGTIKFHTYLGVEVPARDIDNVLELDPSYLETLFD